MCGVMNEQRRVLPSTKLECFIIFLSFVILRFLVVHGMLHFHHEPGTPIGQCKRRGELSLRLWLRFRGPQCDPPVHARNGMRRGIRGRNAQPATTQGPVDDLRIAQAFGCRAAGCRDLAFTSSTDRARVYTHNDDHTRTHMPKDTIY